MHRRPCFTLVPLPASKYGPRYMLHSKISTKVLEQIRSYSPRCFAKADKSGLTPVHEYFYENKSTRVEVLQVLLSFDK